MDDETAEALLDKLDGIRGELREANMQLEALRSSNSNAYSTIAVNWLGLGVLLGLILWRVW